MKPLFDWLKDSGTQAVELFITACAAIGALLLTWHFGRKSLTKRDLAPMEENTGHLEDVRAAIASVDSRLKKQEDTEALRIRASRVSMRAMGNLAGSAPYPLQLFVQQPTEPNLLLTHVELCNESGTSFGSFPCSRFGDPNGLNFQAEVPMTTMGNWFRSGTPDQSMNRMRLKLKVWMTINGTEAPRDMPVTVLETSGGYAGYTLNGSV